MGNFYFISYHESILVQALLISLPHTLTTRPLYQDSWTTQYSTFLFYDSGTLSQIISALSTPLTLVAERSGGFLAHCILKLLADCSISVVVVLYVITFILLSQALCNDDPLYV